MCAARLIDPATDPSYEAMWGNFRWEIPDRLNIAQVCVDAHAANRVGLVTVDADGQVGEHTFGDLATQSSWLAAGLRNLGVERGDRVAVLVPQSLETALTHLAVWKLGAVSVPLSALFGPDALRYRLQHSETKLAVATTEGAEKLAQALPSLSVLSTGHGLRALMGGAPLDRVADTRPDDPAFLIYTSGTTGPAKGALHGHRSLLGHVPGFEVVYELAPQASDVIWTPADWSWIAGLMDVLVPAWYHGIPVVTNAAEFDPQGAIDLMVAQRVTLAFLPPTALKLMRAADVDARGLCLRAILSGGESLGAEVLTWARDTLGCQVNEGYGQTEANLVVGNCGGRWPVKPGAIGRPLPGHTVVVLGDDGQPVVGEVGEIAVAAEDPVVMLGYWRDPEATAAKIAGGWLLTGDLGREDDDGYLWFESRKDDVIKSRGYRIGPGEIEDCLVAHPAVAMSAVTGVPDATYGAVPVAFVVLRDGHAPDDQLAQELRDHVRTRLAAHEVPRWIQFADELPRTATGKILRRELRDKWLQSQLRVTPD